MFILVIGRVIRYTVGVNPYDQYAPRSNNLDIVHWSGPFRERANAETALVNVLLSSSCTWAHILTYDQVRAIAANQTDPLFHVAVHALNIIHGQLS